MRASTTLTTLKTLTTVKPEILEGKPLDLIDFMAKEKEKMKEICKNCSHCHPTYKGSMCELTGKKTKQQGTCENWRQKRERTWTS